MTEPSLRIVFLGLSITSSWGNGHATTYRALIRALGEQGHDVLFLERDVPWYRENRDCLQPPGCRVGLYRSVQELQRRWAAQVREADAVIVGSYVPEGCKVARWVQRTAQGVVAFYDIDTPVTLAKLARGDDEYLNEELIPGFHLYLSFTGGPILDRLEQKLGAQRAVPLYCSVDADHYRPDPGRAAAWDLGYLGTYSDDRQPKVRSLLLDVARQHPQGAFAVYGPGYPDVDTWPDNVAHHPHLPPVEHPAFYNSQRYTLNVTRADMVAAGFAPSVRLFEAAACGTPIISDPWDGLETLFHPGTEILLARDTAEVLDYLNDLPEDARLSIGRRGRARVLARHTSRHRAAELVDYLRAASGAEVLAASGER